jgi:transposase
MKRRYGIDLNEDERQHLNELCRKGVIGVRKYKRAQVLLLADQGLSNESIAEQLGVGTATVYRVRRDFVEQGLESALAEQSRIGRPRKLSGTEQALLIATACTKAPAGAARWTLQLLGERMVALTEHDKVSAQTIMRRLRENDLKPWQKKMWCLAEMDAEYVARMEDVLSLYAEPANPDFPVVNFDEAMKQLVAQTRMPTCPKPGQSAREHYEYRRAGAANIFLFFDRHRGWRHAKVTQRKTAHDFAECMRDLVGAVQLLIKRPQLGKRTPKTTGFERKMPNSEGIHRIVLSN